MRLFKIYYYHYYYYKMNTLIVMGVLKLILFLCHFGGYFGFAERIGTVISNVIQKGTMRKYDFFNICYYLIGFICAWMGMYYVKNDFKNSEDDISRFISRFISYYTAN